MKRKTFIISAVVIAAMTIPQSCETEHFTNGIDGRMEKKMLAEGTMTLTATLEKPQSDTKTSLSEGSKVVWTTGDKIKVYNASNSSGVEFTLSSAEGSETGTFTGNISGSGPFYAVYPASAGGSLSGTTLNLNLPGSQTYKDGSFSNGANIAVAYGSDLSPMSFKNTCGLLAIPVSGSGSLKSIRITAKGSEKLNGSASVNMNYGTGSPSLSVTETGSSDSYKTITLNCSSASLSGSAKYFYFVVPAEALAGGFETEIVSSDNWSMVKSARASSDNQVKRSKITTMPSFSFEKQYGPNFQINDYAVLTSNGKGRQMVTGSQYACFTNSDGRTFRLQDWNTGYAIILSGIPASLPTDGSSFSMNVECMGATNEFSANSSVTARIVKRFDSKVWLTDGSGNCYIIKVD